MTSSLDSTCPSCGAESSAADPQTRAFVPYEPEPNGAQAECEWTDDLPNLWALVCTECAYVLGVIDANDPERAEDRVNEFRVDEELR